MTGILGTNDRVFPINATWVSCDMSVTCDRAINFYGQEQSHFLRDNDMREHLKVYFIAFEFSCIFNLMNVILNVMNNSSLYLISHIPE